MSAISLRLPDSLHQALKGLSKKEHVSINQVITLAVAEKMSALMTEDYLARRGARANRKSCLKALSKVKDRRPQPGDEL